MYKSQIEQVRQTSKAFYEVAEHVLGDAEVTGRVGIGEVRRAILDNVSLESFDADPEFQNSQVFAEAIILSKLRPAYFVLESGIDLDNDIVGDAKLVDLIADNKSQLETICQSVGRVDLMNHWSLPYGGTGFLIDDDLAVTNRHVAQLFAESIWNGYRFKRGRFGQDMESRLDYFQLHQSTQHQRAEVEEVVYIAKAHEPDFALLRVRKRDNVAPLVISQKQVPDGLPVAVVGYPAADGDRNEKELMEEVFGGVYDVKRFAPGFITGRGESEIVLTSDYSSMGGNSGSAVVGLENGEVVGLHFAGRFRENNYAVTANIVSAARRQVMKPFSTVAMPSEAPTSSAADLRGRNGYDPEFLGIGKLTVGLPLLGTWAADIAPVQDSEDNVLRYQNFSIIQSASRKLPLMTAVNIDGKSAKRLRRKGKWKLDGRLDAAHQIGNELYRRNPFDRGHMVRRRDPGWGGSAQQAEIDTFHYTNCVPQHKDLNQRHWVELEDYILEATETKEFRASIFTGPIFRDSDKRLKRQPDAEGMLIPEEFWKVAVIVSEATGTLSATGYILSHGPFIRDLVESPFIYGSYRTYQVQIARIEAETGLSFSTLPEMDPLGADLNNEAPFTQVAREIGGPDSLVLSPLENH